MLETLEISRPAHRGSIAGIEEQPLPVPSQQPLPGLGPL